MQRVEIDIPDEVVDELEAYRGRMTELLLRGLAQLKVDEALALYQRGGISIGRAVELSGLTRDAFVRAARVAGVTPAWTEATVAQELA